MGGALTGNCCLLANPDGSTWVFDNGADADPGASVTKLGTSLGDPETRLTLSYPPMSAFTAAWVTASELLTIGNPDFRITSVARDRDGTVYLASYYPTAEPGLTFAVIRLTGLNGAMSRQ